MAYSKARKLADIVDIEGVVSYDSLSDGAITAVSYTHLTLPTIYSV